MKEGWQEISIHPLHLLIYFKYLIGFIFSLQSDCCVQRLAEVDVENIIGCHRWPNGYPQPLWSCLGHYCGHPTFVHDLKEWVMKKTLVILACSQPFPGPPSPRSSLCKLRWGIQYKINEVFGKTKLYIWTFRFWSVDVRLVVRWPCTVDRTLESNDYLTNLSD